MLALKECDALTDQAAKFQEEFIIRGNQALYKLLSDIYSFALKVRLSEYHHHIIVVMKSALKDRDIKVQENTSETMIIVKYIVGDDRKRADVVFFMARYDHAKGVYRILHVHNFGQKFKNQMIHSMAKGVKANLETLEVNLRNYCQKRIDAQKVPEVIANIWRKGRLQLPAKQVVTPTDIV
ncbi:hypothetical protein [Polynucleobacter necessarius]|uniref:hypothetical protein n=1 Tax=Polynucleobacter necessarius TaxID=576610 RepID=UPI000E092C1C|nr:hypothetical protein [Polynucleobacter necessarius]